jgi:hypothetical protein
VPTNTQFERSRRTPSAPLSGSGQRGLAASHATRLSFRVGPEHWLLAGVVCCAVLILTGMRVFAPSLADEARTPPPVAVNVQASTERELDRTGYVKGLYISRAALGNADFVKHVQDLLENTELNAVVMDFKGDRGQLTFPTQVARAQEIGADSEAMVKDPAAFLKWFKDRGVYTIARIPVSKDNLLAQAHPEWAVINANTGKIWRDPEKMGWVDPNHEAVWDYNIALAVEAAQMGFDEVQYDYVRFPTDGNVGVAQFSLPNTEENRLAAIAGLLQRTQAALKPLGTKLGVDTFGYASWVANDLGIGQHIETIAPYIDVLSPMVYPSTFDSGLPGEAGRYRNAIAYPYEVVRKSTERSVERARAVNPAIQVRPWIQDFQDYSFDYRTYTPGEIRAQMDGAREGGGHGWILWDAAVRYTREALVSAQPAYPPNLAGKVLAIAYRDISEDGGSGSRTPAQLRADLERLLAGGYYPVNVSDVVEGKLSMVPAGKRPVVLTFDDSTPGQLRIRSNGAVEPETAVGVLLDFHAAHPADWPLKATFFVQSPPDGQELGEQIFGAPDLAAAKLQMLIDLGMEIGAQPVGQAKLTGLSSEEVQRVIAQSLHQLSSLLPNYKVVSLAVPEGRLPPDLALLRGGTADGETYALSGAVTPKGGLMPSPLAPQFDPFRLPRVPAAELDAWLKLADKTDAYYVSAGEALTETP